jgi:hypothetical protein
MIKIFDFHSSKYYVVPGNRRYAPHDVRFDRARDTAVMDPRCEARPLHGVNAGELVYLETRQKTANGTVWRLVERL